MIEKLCDSKYTCLYTYIITLPTTRDKMSTISTRNNLRLVFDKFVS